MREVVVEPVEIEEVVLLVGDKALEQRPGGDPGDHNVRDIPGIDRRGLDSGLDAEFRGLLGRELDPVEAFLVDRCQALVPVVDRRAGSRAWSRCRVPADGAAQR